MMITPKTPILLSILLLGWGCGASKAKNSDSSATTSCDSVITGLNAEALPIDTQVTDINAKEEGKLYKSEKTLDFRSGRTLILYQPSIVPSQLTFAPDDGPYYFGAVYFNATSRNFTNKDTAACEPGAFRNTLVAYFQMDIQKHIEIRAFSSLADGVIFKGMSEFSGTYSGTDVDAMNATIAEQLNQDNQGRMTFDIADLSQLSVTIPFKGKETTIKVPLRKIE